MDYMWVLLAFVLYLIFQTDRGEEVGVESIKTAKIEGPTSENSEGKKLVLCKSTSVTFENEQP